VTKADEGVAPTVRGATQIVTSNNGSGKVGIAEVTHELVRGQLSEYLDDSLTESDRRRVEGHLAACPPCTAYLNTLRATVRALGVLPAPKAPSGIRARIVEQARRESE
jgi:anti-sigma factor RsiW